MFARVLYCIFLGLLVAFFVAWAMDAWFPTPQWDKVYPGVERYPQEPIPPSSEELNMLSAETKSARVQQYEADRAAFEEWKTNRDQREEEFTKLMDKQGITVALISMAIAVVVTTVSLLYSGRLQVITEGMLLGGIFTLIYSLGWTFIRTPKIAVWAVAVSLVITIAVGYMKFVRKPEQAATQPPQP